MPLTSRELMRTANDVTRVLQALYGRHQKLLLSEFVEPPHRILDFGHPYQLLEKGFWKGDEIEKSMHPPRGNKLTRFALPDLLCRNGEDAKHFSHYFHYDVRHPLRQGNLYICFESSEEALDALKEVNE